MHHSTISKQKTILQKKFCVIIIIIFFFFTALTECQLICAAKYIKLIPLKMTDLLFMYPGHGTASQPATHHHSRSDRAGDRYKSVGVVNGSFQYWLADTAECNNQSKQDLKVLHNKNEVETINDIETDAVMGLIRDERNNHSEPHPFKNVARVSSARFLLLDPSLNRITKIRKKILH